MQNFDLKEKKIIFFINTNLWQKKKPIDAPVPGGEILSLFAPAFFVCKPTWRQKKGHIGKKLSTVFTTNLFAENLK